MKHETQKEEFADTVFIIQHKIVYFLWNADFG